MKKAFVISALLTPLAFGSIFGQGIGNEEITITKERQVSLPKANRIYDKIQVIEPEKASKKITYTFFDRKPTGIERSVFKPSVVDPAANGKDNFTSDGYYNYLKLGAGNFGRLFGELNINSFQNDHIVFGLNMHHNSAKRGPVEGENSGSSISKIDFHGKYHSNGFELKAFGGYERNNYYFYGYDTTAFANTFEKEDIKQLLNKFNFGVGFENTDADAVIDYQLLTQIKTLNDYLSAEEIDWGTNLNLKFNLIPNKIVGKINADAYISQRTDNDIQRIQKRNLFRVQPSFVFNYNQFSAEVGYRAVNQFDAINQVNETVGFPTVELTYKTPNLLYFSAGYDGDIVRNTLGSFLNDNPFLRSQVPLLNTTKDREIYVSSKGDIYGGSSYNVKLAYGSYSNLYFFTPYDGNQRFESRKYDIVYDANSNPFFHGNLQVNYQPTERIRSNVNFNYYYYGTEKFEKPFHRPSIDLTFSNSFVIQERFVAAVDLFLLGGMYAQDSFNFNEVTKLPTIVDLNTKFDYLLSDQFTCFVQLNNLLNQNYQRFLFYPKQGLNFLVGVNVSI
jgi:hypothetical protein